MRKLSRLDCPRCVELAARVIELEGELARMRTARTPMGAVERARLLAERQCKHYEERKGVLPEMTFRTSRFCLVEGAG
jgi:hypothetical protein